MNGYRKPGAVWPGWVIGSLIGGSSDASVYEASLLDDMGR